MLKPALRFLLLLLLALPLLLASRLPGTHQLLLGTSPWLVCAITLMLSLGFKQSKIFLMSLHLAAVAALLHMMSAPDSDSPATFITLILLGLTWPLLHTGILLMSTRRTLSRTGLMRIISILAAYACLALLWAYAPMLLVRLLPELPRTFIEQLLPGLSISPAVFWWQASWLAAGTALARILRCNNIGVAGILGFSMLLMQVDTGTALHIHLYHLLGQLLLLATVIRRGYDMAFVDTLTGIPGRRALEHYLLSPGKGYSIAMLDIDHFKQCNDRYGHDMGDQVLRMVASQLKHVGAGGRLFRYGGEEFTIVFRHSAEDMLLDALENIRERIASYPMRIRSANRPDCDETGRARRNHDAEEQGIRVTISIGFCTQRNDETTETVIRQADQALYAAKRAGRNCIRTARQSSRHKKGRSRTDFARHQG